MKRFPNCVSFVRALGAVIGRPDSFIDIDVPTPPPVRPLAPEERTPPTAPRYRSEPGRRPGAPRPVDPENDSLHATLVHGEVGTLRPAVFVGVGRFGMLALKELRRRLLDRVGDLSQSPAFRFLYIDADPEGATEAMEGPADKALRDDQVFPVRLQPVTNYRRRMLDHLNEWLPREKLHSIPRSLQTLGSRALGRLAFCDNFLRFDTRFTREIQIATHPESLAQTMTQSGMTLRDNCPRVYVLASATGGTSGMLTDLGFSIRRKLAKMQFTKAPVSAFLFCGAPHDPTMPKAELGNLVATLTELNHFHDSAITFSAQYGGPDGPKIVAQEYPYSSIYLMERESRGPDSPDQCAAHLASYLVQDLSTPLGAELDGLRDQVVPTGKTPFRSFGAAGIWFPRGLMMRSAARLMCQRLLLEWQEAGPLHSYKPVDDLVAKMQITPALQTDAMTARLDKAATAGGPAFHESLAELLAELETALPNVGDDAAVWAKTALDRVTAFVGASSEEGGASSYLHARVTRSLNQAVIDLANELAARLNEYAILLMESPGKRIAATEAALYRMGQFCTHQADVLARKIGELSSKTSAAWGEVKGLAEVCMNGPGFRLFGSRTSRNLRLLHAALGEYGKAKLREQIVGATARLYRLIHNGLEEKLRDLTFCRQRLTHLERIMEPDSAGSHSGSHPGLLPASASGAALTSVNIKGSDQVLLPFGESDIEWAAARFVMNISAEQWTRLEEILQSLVLAPLGGLYAMCQKAGDLMGQLAGPLIDQTAAYLNKILDIADVAEGEFVAGGKRANIVTLVQKCWERAHPLVAGEARDQTGFLIVPGTEAGAALSAEIREALPSIKILQTIGQTSDIMVCREQGFLTAKSLDSMLDHCREAYADLASRSATSPHSRFDILEWMPLDM